MSIATPRTAATLPNATTPDRLEPVCVILAATFPIAETGLRAVTDCDSSEISA